ncbi:FeoA family protein [Propionimicrobium sp. PCR01-08-3]|uniref:FeoA family protein n=1 Tax=Propionimicrobium sp. PCR01-08-3 TaxID=3052086 RepID=UPI00255D0104|nr:FeoA family protein [Propionimicrobium sp. PCR01-08-3]WIY83973.1 FeoA family protein [Propionimicrobium sp. PCR01-08-3]
MSNVIGLLCERGLDLMDDVTAGQDGCVPMSQLRAGQRGVIAGFRDVDDMATSRRLFDLGFSSGTEVEFIRRAPLRGPLMFRVATNEMLLRKPEADLVIVRPS